MKARKNIARTLWTGILTAGLTLAIPSVVLAQRIFVNDVEVTHANMRNTNLERVDSVVFDNEGNIRITAPTYNIQVVAPGSPASTSASSTGQSASSAASSGRTTITSTQQGQSAAQSAARQGVQGTYVMTISNPEPGSVPYEVDIVINGKHVATWGSQRSNSALNVTAFMQRGRNVVTFQARRTPGAPTTGTSEMRIAIGEGTMSTGQATVSNILAGQIFRASDTDRNRSQSVDFEIER